MILSHAPPTCGTMPTALLSEFWVTDRMSCPSILMTPVLAS
jgi:hypothetical protein